MRVPTAAVIYVLYAEEEPDLHDKIYRENLMRKVLIVSVILCLLYGCGKKHEILFCEGVSPSGDGVSCGTVFESGDLTMLVKSESQFSADQIKILINEIKGEKVSLIKSMPVPVNPEENKVAVPLSFYSEGSYTVKAVKDDEEIANGNIKIIDY